MEDVVASWRRVASTHDLQELLLEGDGSTPLDQTEKWRQGWPRRRALGLFLMLVGAAIWIVIAAIMVIKFGLLPQHVIDNTYITAVKEDEYYCYMPVALIPVTFATVVVNWFFMKLFKHNA